jgi:magnesium-transporting ATPase (P-type)
MKKKGEEKKKKNNYTFKAALGTVALLVILVALLFVGDQFFSFRHADNMEEGERAPPPSANIYFDLMSILSLSMLLLSCYLSYIYLRDYLELKSGFTLGLLTAVIALMMFALTSNPLIHVLFGVYGRMGAFSLLPYLFATTSLAILCWLSSK